MIFDKLTEIADAAVLSLAATGRQAVGTPIDLGVVSRDIGAGKPLYMVITVDTAILSGGSATVSFEIVSDSVNPVAVDGTATLHAKTADVAKATLVAGYTMVIPLPSVNPVYEQYLGLIVNVGTAVLTAGKINAFLTIDPSGWKAYPNENSLP